MVKANERATEPPVGMPTVLPPGGGPGDGVTGGRAPRGTRLAVMIAGRGMDEVLELVDEKAGSGMLDGILADELGIASPTRRALIGEAFARHEPGVSCFHEVCL